MTEPRNANAIADAEMLDVGCHGLRAADNLVAGDDRQSWFGEVAVDNVQVGAANTASGNLEQDLA